jgi:hypothetical protein
MHIVLDAFATKTSFPKILRAEASICTRNLAFRGLLAFVCFNSVLLFLALLAARLTLSLLPGLELTSYANYEVGLAEAWGICLVAPATETLLWQALIVEIGITFGFSRTACISTSMCAFAIVHYCSPYAIMGLVPGVVGGLLLARYYLELRKQSFHLAVLGTALIHSCTNSMTVLCLFLY